MSEQKVARFFSQHKWSQERPHVLVVACSDGRLQRGVDDFLNSQLYVRDYDRLYLPGGPGALASSGVEYLRSDRHRKEFLFLLEAHEIQTVVLLFHGPAEGGPELAICADYMRALNTTDPQKVFEMQSRDYQEIRNDMGVSLAKLNVMGYRCEVMASLEPRFVELDQLLKGLPYEFELVERFRRLKALVPEVTE